LPIWRSVQCRRYPDTFSEEIIQTHRARVKVAFRIEQDRALMRRCDEPVIAGDITKFRHSTGWSPGIDLAGTLQDMLEWWRYRFRSCRNDRECSKQVPAPSGATSVNSAIGVAEEFMDSAEANVGCQPHRRAGQTSLAPF
jgi:hypothetical protein